MQDNVFTMLEMQDAMNTRVHPEWRKQGFAWYRAIWTECAELLDHHGWKWWKKQDPDMEQVKLELIDIWHFGMSILLVNADGKSTDELAGEIATAFDVDAGAESFLEAVETFACDCLATHGFSTARFAQVIQAAGMSLDELYRGYVGKNVLNFFRQDHGYKDGSYIKVWNGREDNEHLVDLVQELNSQSASFKDDLYAGLKDRYTALNA